MPHGKKLSSSTFRSGQQAHPTEDKTKETVSFDDLFTLVIGLKITRVLRGSSRYHLSTYKCPDVSWLTWTSWIKALHAAGREDMALIHHAVQCHACVLLHSLFLFARQHRPRDMYACCFQHDHGSAGTSSVWQKIRSESFHFHIIIHAQADRPAGVMIDDS